MIIFLRQVILVPLILVSLCGTCTSNDNAQSGFNIFIFGQNLRSLENSNWFKIAVGATASLLAHELGHALALELAGKSWDFQASWPSGFAVHTDEFLDDSESLNIGRAGFALQSLIGFGLTTLEITRRSDFTKGWVGMNALQITSYKFRPHDIDDDFAIIDKGGGNIDLEFAILSLLSFNNLLCLDSAPWTFMTEFLFSSHFKSDKIIEPIENNKDIFTMGIDLDLSATLLPKVKLPHFYPQNAFGQTSFHWGGTMLAKSPLSN